MLQPAAEMKMIQGWLLVNVLSKLPVNKVATAFHPGTSIVKNANAHKDSLYSVRVDLVDFFPSIRRDDLMQVLSNAIDILPSWTTQPDFGPLIAKACFGRDGCLPIGYLTSPCIANAVMFDFDRNLEKAIAMNIHRFGHTVLTRYADDFVFSTDRRGACREFVDTIRELISKTSSPILKINEGKARYMSRAGGSTLVTGLRINQEGIVRVHPKYRDHVRLLLKLYSLGKLAPDDHLRLRGHLAFVEHADARLFTHMSYRYFEEIARLRKDSSSPIM